MGKDFVGLTRKFGRLVKVLSQNTVTSEAHVDLNAKDRLCQRPTLKLLPVMKLPLPN